MYKKTVLPNRARIITHEMKDRESASLGIWLGVGGRYENKKNKGAAHFLEHILFKGSKHYSCSDIKELIEGVGGTLNAFTAEEYTCYYSKIPSMHLDRTFDILSDMVFYPLAAAKDVQKERTVILEEIKMYHDLPQHFVIDLLEGLMWTDHPLGMNIAGTLESIGGMSEEDLRQFHHAHYALENMVVAASGRLSHEPIVHLVQKKSAAVKETKKQNSLSAQNWQDRPKVKFFRKDIEQMHLALGVFGLEEDHKDRHAYALLNIILGSNMSSRLFNEVREKRGLAYAIASSTKSLRDAGLLMIRAGVDNKKLVEAVSVILKELQKLKRENVTKDEFTRARDYYMGQILLALEDTLDHMFWIGESTISLNKTRTIKQILSEVRKVTIDDIRRVANGIFKKEHTNLAIVGPLKEEQENQLSDLMNVK